jgi:hypothetical protein
MIVKDAASYVEQVSDKRITQRITHRQTILLSDHNVLVPQDCELLGDNRLIQFQRYLQLLHGPFAMDQDLKNLDPDGVCQRPEKLGFERLKLAACHRFAAPSLGR